MYIKCLRCCTNKCKKWWLWLTFGNCSQPCTETSLVGLQSLARYQYSQLCRTLRSWEGLCFKACFGGEDYSYRDPEKVNVCWCINQSCLSISRNWFFGANYQMLQHCLCESKYFMYIIFPVIPMKQNGKKMSVVIYDIATWSMKMLVFFYLIPGWTIHNTVLRQALQ